MVGGEGVSRRKRLQGGIGVEKETKEVARRKRQCSGFKRESKKEQGGCQRVPEVAEVLTSHPRIAHGQRYPMPCWE